MENSDNKHLIPTNLSFESLKKLNPHGIEYWSARDLQSCLGYSEWRKFETTIKKAIDSCKQSGNEPENHFVGADKMVQIGSQTDRKVKDWHLSRFACYLIAQTWLLRYQILPIHFLANELKRPLNYPHPFDSIKRPILWPFFWPILAKNWPELESNQRHKDFQSSALPTELSGHKMFKILQDSWFEKILAMD